MVDKTASIKPLVWINVSLIIKQHFKLTNGAFSTCEAYSKMIGNIKPHIMMETDGLIVFLPLKVRYIMRRNKG